MADTPVTVLLAEDEDAERTMLATFLGRKGYRVTEAGTGAEARDLFRDLRPDIVISDLRMADLDGLGLLESIRDAVDYTPFVIVSGLGTMDDVIKGLRLGAWDYLIKPIYPLELLEHSVERALERARLIRENREHSLYLEETVRRRSLELLEQNKAFEQEINRRELQEKLTERARNEWERTVDALPDMIVIVDLDHRVVRVNKTVLEILGLPAEKIVGRQCFMCSRSMPCSHTLTMMDRKPRKSEVYMKRLDCHYELNIVPYYSPDNRLIGSVHVFRDITEQKQNDKERELLQVQLLHAQKLESVGQLASGIAHEINTPTQFVSSNVEFLAEAFTDISGAMSELIGTSGGRALSGEEIRAALDRADWSYLAEEIPTAIRQSQEGLARVTSIVRAMKEFSHPGGKEAEIADLNNIIEVTVTVARNEWKYVSEVELDLAPDLAPVSCLIDEIGQVILNLLVNAAHAIAEKLGDNPEGDKGTITIRTASDDKWVVIEVSDTGCGIPEHARAKIFDPFFTTKAVGRGTGQGLAIAYDVITGKHGGTLTFETETGKGTSFTIRLPIDRNHKR